MKTKLSVLGGGGVRRGLLVYALAWQSGDPQFQSCRGHFVSEGITIVYIFKPTIGERGICWRAVLHFKPVIPVKEMAYPHQIRVKKEGELTPLIISKGVGVSLAGVDLKCLKYSIYNSVISTFVYTNWRKII